MQVKTSCWGTTSLCIILVQSWFELDSDASLQSHSAVWTSLAINSASSMLVNDVARYAILLCVLLLAVQTWLSYVSPPYALYTDLIIEEIAIIYRDSQPEELRETWRRILRTSESRCGTFDAYLHKVLHFSQKCRIITVRHLRTYLFSGTCTLDY